MKSEDIDRLKGFVRPKDIGVVTGQGLGSFLFANYQSNDQRNADAIERQQLGLRLLTSNFKLSVHASEVNTVVARLQLLGIGAKNAGGHGGGAALSELSKLTIHCNKLRSTLEGASVVHAAIHGQKQQTTRVYFEGDSPQSSSEDELSAMQVAVKFFEKMKKAENALRALYGGGEDDAEERFGPWAFDLGSVFKSNPDFLGSKVSTIFTKVFSITEGARIKVFQSQYLKFDESGVRAGTLDIKLNYEKIRNDPMLRNKIFSFKNDDESLQFLDDLEASGLKSIRIYNNRIHLLRGLLGYDSNVFKVSEQSSVSNLKSLAGKLSACFRFGDPNYMNSGAFYADEFPNDTRMEFRFEGYLTQSLPDVEEAKKLMDRFKGDKVENFLQGLGLQFIQVTDRSCRVHFVEEFECVRPLLNRDDGAKLSPADVKIANAFLTKGLIFAGFSDHDLMVRLSSLRLAVAAE